MHCEKQMQGKPSTLLKTIVTTMNFVSVMIFFPLCLTCTHFWNCRLFVQYALRIFLKMRSQSMRVCVGIGNLFSAVYEKMLISNSPRKHMYFYFIFFLNFVLSSAFNAWCLKKMTKLQGHQLKLQYAQQTGTFCSIIVHIHTIMQNHLLKLCVRSFTQYLGFNFI